MATLRFTGEMRLRGVNPYVVVTKTQAAQLAADWRRPMPVLVRVNSQPKEAWHINMMPVGNGDFYLYLHGNVRKASSTKVGDTVTIELDFDTDYKNGPQHPMPTDFAAMLQQNPAARANWDALPPSRQKEILRYCASLKSEEARQRNYHRTLAALSGIPTQFMGRPWRNGS